MFQFRSKQLDSIFMRLQIFPRVWAGSKWDFRRVQYFFFQLGVEFSLLSCDGFLKWFLNNNKKIKCSLRQLDTADKIDNFDGISLIIRDVIAVSNLSKCLTNEEEKRRGISLKTLTTNWEHAYLCKHYWYSQQKCHDPGYDHDLTSLAYGAHVLRFHWMHYRVIPETGSELCR